MHTGEWPSAGSNTEQCVVALIGFAVPLTGAKCLCFTLLWSSHRPFITYIHTSGFFPNIRRHLHLQIQRDGTTAVGFHPSLVQMLWPCKTNVPPTPTEQPCLRFIITWTAERSLLVLHAVCFSSAKGQVGSWCQSFPNRNNTTLKQQKTKLKRHQEKSPLNYLMSLFVSCKDVMKRRHSGWNCGHFRLL